VAFGRAAERVRDAAKTTLNCTRCQAAPAPSDDTAPYDVTAQINQREAQLTKAASGK